MTDSEAENWKLVRWKEREHGEKKKREKERELENKEEGPSCDLTTGTNRRHEVMGGHMDFITFLSGRGALTGPTHTHTQSPWPGSTV